MNDKASQDYKKQGDDLVFKMTIVLMKAQRKVDDKKYRDTLEKLKEV